MRGACLQIPSLNRILVRVELLNAGSRTRQPWSRKMKLKHHFWSSLALGGALSAATHSWLPLAGTMVGGVLIDSDHVIDHVWSVARGYPYMYRSRIWLNKKNESAFWRKVGPYVVRRKLRRLPLVFHSYELLTLTVVATALFHSPFLIGFTSGYLLHVFLDFVRHRHEFSSPLFYLLSYRLAHGFRRDKLIKPEHY